MEIGIEPLPGSSLGKGGKLIILGARENKGLVHGSFDKLASGQEVI